MSPVGHGTVGRSVVGHGVVGHGAVGHRPLNARGRAGACALALLLPALLALSSACRGRTLTNTLESPDAIARAVLKGLDAKDADALRALAVTEDEFHDLVWPRLPTSRPGRNLPWDYVWNDLHGKSRMQLQARLNEWQDRGYTFVRIDFKGETTDYQTYRIRRESLVTLRDRDGQETSQRLFGSIIEQNGRYKVFSYNAD